MGLTRIAILFNSSLPERDGTAAYDRSFILGLQPILLDEERFDRVYRLDDECAKRDVREEVLCLPPTLKSLETVVQEITDKFSTTGDEVSVFTFVNGHGSPSYNLVGIAGKDFAAVLNKLPSEVSRITTLHMCYGAGFALFGLMDENDLLKAYAGKEELNWDDATRITILQRDRDPNGDGILTNQEEFWLGQSYIYNSLAPYRRHFVFRRGPNFVDRGLGTKPATPPFPASLVEVKDVPHYLRLTQQGANQGITIIGLEGREGGKPLKKQLETAAVQEGGVTQFLWISRSLAAEAARPNDLPRLRKESIYKVFYHGSDESLSFNHRQSVKEVLRRIYFGETIGGKK